MTAVSAPSRTGFSEKVFRDPVYGNISVFSPAVMEIIDSPEFQRLRRINQLGMCHTVYHGAEHSRFQHSLGAMWLMHRVLRNWDDSRKIDMSPEVRLAATLAALLHDVGHGPFSHALENVFTHFHHEEIGKRIVSERLRPILERHGVDTDLILGIMRGNAGMPFLTELIASQVDVDRMDYLLRDSLYAGVRYGYYDIDRMIYALTPIPDATGYVLALDPKGIHVAEEYLFSRYSMYWQVYFHKTTRSCEIALRAVLARARDLFASRPEALYIPPNLGFVFEPPLSGRSGAKSKQEWLENFIQIDDTDFYHAIKLWRKSDDAILADLADRFINRRLLKTIPAPRESGRRAAIRDLVAARMGAEAARYYYHLDRPSDSAYDYYGPGKTAIRVVTRWHDDGT
ncbi:MAG: HD domain-containing protein, partial [Armatimonadetes bacterium]|nr:HD domain-containing protein [Armatimonadota bacterium]